jgi:hypothetical protein
MIKPCHRCKECHNDLTIEKSLGMLQMSIMYEMNHFDNEDQGEICLMYRKAAAYQLIEDTLKQYGIIQ